MIKEERIRIKCKANRAKKSKNNHKIKNIMRWRKLLSHNQRSKLRAKSLNCLILIKKVIIHQAKVKSKIRSKNKIQKFKRARDLSIEMNTSKVRSPKSILKVHKPWKRLKSQRTTC